MLELIALTVLMAMMADAEIKRFGGPPASDSDGPWLFEVGDLWAENLDNVWPTGLTPEGVARDISEGRANLDLPDHATVLHWVARLRPHVDRPGYLLSRDDWIQLEKDSDVILDGFHRMTAAHLLGMRHYPVWEVDVEYMLEGL